MPLPCAGKRDFGVFRKALLPHEIATSQKENVDKTDDDGKHEQKKAVEQNAPTKQTESGQTDGPGEEESRGKGAGRKISCAPRTMGKKAKNEENLRKFEKNKGAIVDEK